MKHIARGALCLIVLFGMHRVPAAAEDQPAAADYSAVVAEALDGLSTDAMLATIKALTHDKMQGRKTGTPGGANAEEWIAAKYAEYGMHPADQAGAYLEPFTFTSSRIKAPISLQVASSKKAYGNDYLHIDYTGTGDVSAPVVFCRHGLQRPDLKLDDYAGVDVKGKIVLVLTGGPRDVAWRQSNVGRADVLGHKVAIAAKQGAVGVLLVNPMDRQVGVYSIGARYHCAAIPALTVSRAVAGELLGAESKLSGPSTATTTTVSMTVNGSVDAKALGHNVLARFDGRDPDLKHEVVLVAAQADAFGVRPDGGVYPGAEDRASGVAVLLHLADLFSLNKYRPQRTLVFCAFTGGRHGAEALVQRLPFAGTVVAMIQLDQVGTQLGAPLVSCEGLGEHPVIGGLLQHAKPDEPKVTFMSTGGAGVHEIFRAHRVPSFRLTTQPNAQVRTPRGGDASKVDASSLAATVRVAARFLVALGSAPTPLLPKQAAHTPPK